MMLFDDNEEITINILNNEISLDQKCWCCDGGRKEPDKSFQDVNGICEQCNGTHFIPTSMGISILAFMKRHGGKHED